MDTILILDGTVVRKDGEQFKNEDLFKALDDCGFQFEGETTNITKKAKAVL